VYHGTYETPGTLGAKITPKSPFLVLKRPILEAENHKKALFLMRKQSFFD
jgi:hypothetical protein